jgi:hypothetical protein
MNAGDVTTCDPGRSLMGLCYDSQCVGDFDDGIVKNPCDLEEWCYRNGDIDALCSASVLDDTSGACRISVADTYFCDGTFGPDGRCNCGSF